MQTGTRTASATIVFMANAVIGALIIAALYLGREIFIPLALAALLTFLLSPVVVRLERWIGRIAAVLAMVMVLCGVCGGLGWALTRQMIDLAERLPDYKENIHLKLSSLQTATGGKFKRLSETIKELSKDLPKLEATSTPAPRTPPPPSLTNTAPLEAAEPAPSPSKPLPVEIVKPERVGMPEQMGSLVKPLLGPLGTTALVLLLVIFMLSHHEDLRGRMIRLIGKGNISATTRAMDDAARRVTRYLFMQLIVNASYGLAIGVGLYFIGVPSALFWGALATVLRFIPYIGPWIAAAFPIALSLAVTNNWTMPALTIGLFVVIELLSNNIMEPLLYGSSTGVSAVALIVAAVFWTWLWGAVGLVLAVPLTVCLVVMGRHVPRFNALAVLLSDEKALEPHEEFYHRLLTPDVNDASAFASTYLKTKSLTTLYDAVFIPALAAVEYDKKNDELDDEQYVGIQQELRDVLDDLSSQPLEKTPAEADNAGAGVPSGVFRCRVLCLPTRAMRDEFASTMLEQILRQHRFEAKTFSATLTTGELLGAVENETADAVCISVMPPSTIVHARYLCRKLRAQFPKMHILVGLWGATEDLVDSKTRLREGGADEVVTTLADAVVQLGKYAAVIAPDALLVPSTNDESSRVAALLGTGLLDSAAEPAFDRITRRLTRILEVQIALISFIDAERQFFKSQSGLDSDLSAAGQIPRDVSVCAHVVANREMLIVEDLARDRRFSGDTLFKQRGLRSYAGVPLRTAGGHVIGTLCVLGFKPRRFEENEKRLLEVTAEEIMELIEKRAGPAKKSNESR
ncbi:MAG TPA: AI-2E family transporter [Terrimicrobiaceae bacterium]